MADMNNLTGGPASPSTHAYTRAAVDEYLNAVWLRRQQLEAEITAARRRTARSARAVERLDSLERAVGASLVAAYSQHVATLRRRQGTLTPLETRFDTTVAAPEPAEAILDITDDDHDYDDYAELSIDAPDGFGDEFFGPAPSTNGNGTGHAAGVHGG